MRHISTLALLCAIGFSGVALQAQTLTVLEDFDSLTPGSIDMQHEIDEWGYPVELWNNQANKDGRRDSTWATVEESAGMNGTQCLQIEPRDVEGDLDANFTSMYLGYDNRITDQGTIYLQYKASDANNTIFAFNDHFAGYMSDVEGDDLGEEDEYQGTTNYAEQSALFRLSANQEFRARHDGGYFDVDLGLTADTWYEVWVQFDVPNKQSRYYMCEAGTDNPTVVINPSTSGEWWGWRDDTNASVDNIKIFAAAQGDWAYEVFMYIDTIAIAQEYTTESLWGGGCTLQSDINGDGVVNIYDFLLLRAKYGQTVPAGTPEDINGDGVINIYDFLTLRSEYGMSCEIVY